MNDSFASCLNFCEVEEEGTILDRFEYVLSRLPGFLSIRSENHQWTYAELNARSNAIAHAIIDVRGPGLEPVALLLEHEAPIIAAILGVVKAGKFYSALNSRYPFAYLNELLESLNTTILITDSTHLELARQLIKPGCTLINLDELSDRSFPVDHGSNLTVDSPIAIFYTSGTTGKPKGVIRNHRLILQRSWLSRQFLSILTTDHQSLLTSCSFAVSASDLFSSLLNGCTLCLFPSSQKSVQDLAIWLRKESITLFHPPVALFRSFVSQLMNSDFFPEIRQIMLGGDVLFRRDIELAKNHFPNECLFEHQYASSETGLIARNVDFAHNLINDPIIPAGYPVPGKEIRIIDENAHEVGKNQVGQITVRSRFISPGYWHLPEENRQRFISNNEDSGDNYYLTGDLGRIRPDGKLEFLGRSDSAVKVRGYRVEPALIEASLLEIGFKEVAVIPHLDTVGEKHLVAYLVPWYASAREPKAVRADLAKKLPEYMLPTYYYFLSELPRRENGKLDTRSLQYPFLSESSKQELSKIRQSIENPIEQVILDIVTSQIGNGTIGINDDLFTCGCNSLLAARIIALINEHFRVEIPIREIYNYPTASDLAGFVQARQTQSSPARIMPGLDPSTLDCLSQFA